MSAVQFRNVPTYAEQLTPGSHNNQPWYRWFQDTELGTPPGVETPVVPNGSPFVYTAGRKGFLIVNGGTVSAIGFNRSGTFYTTGQTIGTFTLSKNDQLKVTYSGKPQMIFVPT